MNVDHRPSVIIRAAFLFCAFILPLLTPAYVFASPVETIQSYFYSINKGDYVASAKLFKYPDYATKQEYDDDVQTVSGDLKDLVADFGTVEILNQANAIEGDYSGHGVSAGDAEHLEKYPPQNMVHLQVTFSKVGRGYISFWFNSSEGVDHLVMVLYSTPKNKPQNTEA